MQNSPSAVPDDVLSNPVLLRSFNEKKECRYVRQGTLRFRTERDSEEGLSRHRSTLKPQTSLHKVLFLRWNSESQGGGLPHTSPSIFKGPIRSLNGRAEAAANIVEVPEALDLGFVFGGGMLRGFLWQRTFSQRAADSIYRVVVLERR